MLCHPKPYSQRISKTCFTFHSAGELVKILQIFMSKVFFGSNFETIIEPENFISITIKTPNWKQIKRISIEMDWMVWHVRNNSMNKMFFPQHWAHHDDKKGRRKRYAQYAMVLWVLCVGACVRISYAILYSYGMIWLKFPILKHNTIHHPLLPILWTLNIHILCMYMMNIIHHSPFAPSSFIYYQNDENIWTLRESLFFFSFFFFCYSRWSFCWNCCCFWPYWNYWVDSMCIFVNTFHCHQKPKAVRMCVRRFPRRYHHPHHLQKIEAARELEAITSQIFWFVLGSRIDQFDIHQKKKKKKISEKKNWDVILIYDCFFIRIWKRFFDAWQVHVNQIIYSCSK